MSEYFDQMKSAGEKWRQRVISTVAPVAFNCCRCSARFEKGVTAYVVQTYAYPRYECEACRQVREESKANDRVLG